MQISKQADYALRAMLFLARLKPGELAPTRIIAREMLIPGSFLAKIISQLSLAGLIQTTRGAKGGVSLAKNTDDVTILDVVSAIDGAIKLNECTADPSICPFGEKCPIHKSWVEIESNLVSKMRSYTLTRLLEMEGHSFFVEDK